MSRPRWSLAFEDPAIERDFRERHARGSLPWFRLGLVLGLVLIIAFYGVDALLVDGERYLRAELLRTGLLVSCLGVWWATTRGWWLPVHDTAATVVAVGVVWAFAAISVTADTPPLYIALGTTQMMVWLVALGRVGVSRTVLGTLAMLVPLFLALLVQNVDAGVLVLVGAFVVNFVSVSVMAAYLIESQARQGFAQRRLVRRYAPPAVVDAIEAGLADDVVAPQRRRVTVLFSDVVGFTATADVLDPESLAQVVDEYLGTVTDVVERHGGTLNEFAGDGVMALFGAPTEMPVEDQVVAAIAAAHEIQAALVRLNEGWFRLGLDRPLTARVGINTGVVSVGTFGSDGRGTYTGIGLQTNIAARIQSICEPGSVLISQSSWHLVKDVVPCEERGEAEVKGVHFPIRVYAPVRRRD